MHDFIKKLLDSKSTIIIVLWVIIFAWIYSLDYTRKSVTHTTLPAGKPLEEIMTSPVDHLPEPAWDTEFKSAIREAE